MNCLYITLFFNIAAGIVQTFIKSWNQLLYPRVIEVCRLPFETRARPFFRWRNKWKSLGAMSGLYGGCEFPLVVHLLRWEIVWRNAPRIWRDFGSALPFQTRLTQTKPVPPPSNEHGSQIKVDGIKNFPIGLQVMYLYFPDTPCFFKFLCIH
jgi:hypothetical protein